MAVVMYTVQSRTWTNRMNVDAKFILPGSVKMQQVLDHHFVACRQCLNFPQVSTACCKEGNSLSRWL